MTTSTFRVCRYFNYTNIAEPPTLKIANHKYMYIKLQVHLYHFISVFM